MPGVLTQADLQRLAGEPSAQARAETAEKIGSMFAAANIGERERSIAVDIFRAMARDAEVQVRAALATSLRANPDVPRDVALRLAADVEQVSLPLLRYSPVLNDEDLIAIVASGVVGKQSAIASRVGVSSSVADAIVDLGAADAVAVLLSNETAAVSEGALDRSIDRLGVDAKIQDALARRRLLPVRVAERLVALASESLRDYVAIHHKLSADLATELLLDARERATLGLAVEAADVGALVDELHRNGRLTETVILRALCTGDFDFFEHALARIANVPVASSYALIHDPAGLGQLVGRCGLSREFLAVASLAVEISREQQYDGSPQDRERFSAHVIERMLTQFGESMSADNAGYLMRRLARLSP